MDLSTPVGAPTPRQEQRSLDEDGRGMSRDRGAENNGTVKTDDTNGATPRIEIDREQIIPQPVLHRQPTAEDDPDGSENESRVVEEATFHQAYPVEIDSRVRQPGISSANEESAFGNPTNSEHHIQEEIELAEVGAKASFLSLERENTNEPIASSSLMKSESPNQAGEIDDNDWGSWGEQKKKKKKKSILGDNGISSWANEVDDDGWGDFATSTKKKKQKNLTPSVPSNSGNPQQNDEQEGINNDDVWGWASTSKKKEKEGNKSSKSARPVGVRSDDETDNKPSPVLRAEDIYLGDKLQRDDRIEHKSGHNSDGSLPENSMALVLRGSRSRPSSPPTPQQSSPPAPKRRLRQNPSPARHPSNARREALELEYAARVRDAESRRSSMPMPYGLPPYSRPDASSAEVDSYGGGRRRPSISGDPTDVRARRVAFSPIVEESGPPAETEDDDLSSGGRSDTSYKFALSSTDEKWAAPPNEISKTQTLSLKSTWRSATSAPAALYHGVKSELKVVYSHYSDVNARPNELNIGVTAELETKETEGAATGYDPLFRWVHLEQSVMNFEGFIDCAQNATGINSKDAETISSLLEHFQTQLEKTFRNQQGEHGRFLVPSEGLSITEQVPNGRKTKSVIFFCLPYISLEKIAPMPKHHRGSHVTRSLIQTQFPSAGKDREMQQVVCQIPLTPKEHCFHVPQLWCLVLGDSRGLLITCAKAPFSQIQAAAVNATIGFPKMSTSPQTQYIHIISGYETWLLPAKHCQTWLEFTAHFESLSEFRENSYCGRPHCISDFGLRCYAVKYRGKVVSMDDWPTIIKQSRESQVQLRLVKRSKSHYPPFPDIQSDDESELSSTDDSYWSGEDERSESDVPNTSTWDTQTQVHHYENLHQIPAQLLSPRTQRTQPRKSHKIQSKTRVTRDEDGRFIVETTSTPVKKSLSHRGTNLDQASAFSVDEFHVFTWIAAKPSTTEFKGASEKEPSYVVDGVKVNEDLTAVLKFLWRNPQPVEQSAFRQCPTKTMREVREQMRYMERTGIHYRVYSAARDLLRFFLPLNFDAQIVLKYWGAVSEILAHLHRLPQEAVESLCFSAKVARSLRYVLSDGRAPPVNKLRVPQEFVKAWIHCMSFVVLLGARPGRHLYDRHGWKCFQALKKGQADLTGLLRRVHLKDTEAVPPIVVAMKLAHHLLRERSDHQLDLITTYWTYLSQLELEITKNPLLREHQRKINLLKQELEAAQMTYEDQFRVMNGMRYNLNVFSKRTQEDCREVAITRDAISMAEAKLQGLRDILDRASYLSAEHLRMIESNKDRQEAAIYIFTTVTVIFLPLTFVAGVLGMNTNDIRNMTKDQWVFWVTAIPFTVIVIAICLLFTGELSEFWLSLAKFRPARKNPSQALIENGPITKPQPENVGYLPTYSTEDYKPPPRRRSPPPSYWEHRIPNDPYSSSAQDSRSPYSDIRPGAHSSYADTGSTYLSPNSPYQDHRSSYRQPRSPYQVPRSPYMPSPFAPSPYTSSPYAPSPYSKPPRPIIRRPARSRESSLDAYSEITQRRPRGVPTQRPTRNVIINDYQPWENATVNRREFDDGDARIQAIERLLERRRVEELRFERERLADEESTRDDWRQSERQRLRDRNRQEIRRARDRENEAWE